MKKIIALLLVIALTASVSIAGTIAYLQDEDSDVNVMTMGNVKIEQLEYERVVGESGNWIPASEADKYGYTPDTVQTFTQSKPLYPAYFADGNIKWDDRNGSEAASGDGSHQQSWGQVGASGSNQLFDDSVKNVQDKFVFVKNTGKSDAYVRTLIALEQGNVAADNFKNIIMTNSNKDHWDWETVATDVEIAGNKYYVLCATYLGPKSNPNGILAPGAVSYPSLLQVYMKPEATNDDVEDIDGNGNGTYDIVLLSQAIQTAGFAGAETALDTGFGKATAENVAKWFGGITVPNISTTGSEMNAVVTELPDGTDITKKVTKVVYGKTSDYPDIVNGGYETATLDNATAYYVPDGSNYAVYMLSEGVIYAPVNSKNLFADMSNVTEIDTSNLDFSLVENAVCMFLNCSKLETLDTASWDVSNMTNMQSIFYGCNNLKDIDVSNWDTSNVTNMRMVFFRCYALPNEVLKGVGNWDVSNVSNFYSMFKHARGLTSLDLSKWDTSSATNMSHLFANVGGLEYLDLSGFDTSKVTDMSWMFYDNSKLKTIVVGDGWTTAAVGPSTPTCFYNNQALVGGDGTTWLDVCDMANPNRPWESSAKLVYAVVDGGEANPGLLTHK